jgi:hypothetical protein
MKHHETIKRMVIGEDIIEASHALAENPGKV